MATMTMTETYTWAPGRKFCSAEIHKTAPTCPDCENSGPCADCGHDVIGPGYLYCTQNGEVVHSGPDATCSTTRAAADWVDYY
ncbi:hypothetical protein [Micromonospora sp. NPDC003816]|uniref:hypothetical protein n=1 Tax=Micromonospora sp. NPDC003816 TaxID=3364224 RepID=UPI0036AFEE85